MWLYCLDQSLEIFFNNFRNLEQHKIETHIILKKCNCVFCSILPFTSSMSIVALGKSYYTTVILQGFNIS